MSVKLIGLVFEADLGGLKSRLGHSIAPSTAKLVLLAMADFATSDGTGIHPSLETLSWRTGLPRRTLIDTIRALEDGGLIRRIGRTPKGTIRYEINVEALAARASRSAVTARGECSYCTGGSAVTARGECSYCTHLVQLLHPNQIHEPNTEPNTENRHENHGAARVRAPQEGVEDQRKEGVKKSLEAYFEKNKGQKAPHSSSIPEHLRDLYDAFVKEAGFEPASRAERRRWLADLERMRAAGLEPRHVEAAVRECRGRGLMIKSPASVMTAARNLAAREAERGRPLSWSGASHNASRWEMSPRLPWDQAPPDLFGAWSRASDLLERIGVNARRIVPISFQAIEGGYAIYARSPRLGWLQLLERQIHLEGFSVTIHPVEEANDDGA